MDEESIVTSVTTACGPA